MIGGVTDMDDIETSRRDLHIHWYEGNTSPIERKLTQLMAQIDELTNQFNSLDSAVRDLLMRQGGALDKLQNEINTLIADDAVENGKLSGLSAAAADLRGAVEAFGANAPVDVPVEQTVEPVMPPPEDPIIPPPADPDIPSADPSTPSV